MSSIHQLSFAERLLSSLSSGETLNALVTHRVPEPWMVSAPLSKDVESRLMKMPGLRGQRIVAATTNSRKTVSSLIKSLNPSVRRALAYNPLLTSAQALSLAADAAERKDGATVISLVAGRADFGTLLQAHPSIASLVSAKHTHAGKDLIARRLLCSDRKEAEKILGCYELAARFNGALVERACELSRSSLRSSPETLHLLYNARPQWRRAQDVELISTSNTAGASSSAIEKVLASATKGLREVLIKSLASDPRLSDSEITSLFSIPLPELNLHRCSEQTQQVLARLCAKQLTSLRAYQLFEEMLPDWTESLRDLTTVVSM